LKHVNKDSLDTITENRRLRKAKWHHFYFVLAGLDLLVICLSLTVSHFSLMSYDDLTDDLDYNLQMQNAASSLLAIAQQHNAPGNDVFRTKNVNLERSNLRSSGEAFEQKFLELKNLVMTGATLPEIKHENFEKEFKNIQQSVGLIMRFNIQRRVVLSSLSLFARILRSRKFRPTHGPGV